MLKAILLLVAVPVVLLFAQTQSQMNAQARAEFERTDAELNKTYKALLARIPDAESRQKLQDSQRAWIGFRDAEASFAADQVRGGSAAPVVRYTTMTESTEQRIKQSKKRFPKMNTNASNQSVERTATRLVSTLRVAPISSMFYIFALGRRLSPLSR